MPYLLPCACGQQVEVRKSQAGSFVPCDKCGAQLDVPTIAGLSSLEFVDESPKTQRLPNSRRWTPLRGILAATFFILALAGLTRSGLYAAYRFGNPTQYDVSDFMDAIDAETENMLPAESWDDWRFLQESGLGKKSPPALLVRKRFLEKRDSEMLRWAIAGGVGAAGFLIIAFLPGKK